MNSNKRALREVVYESFRGFVAIAISLILIPTTQQGLFAQDPQPQYPAPQYPDQAPPPPPQGGAPAQAYMPLGADQLNQLVAPIALYPDALVAQVLTASTYPQQIADANTWMQQVGAGMPPDQRAAAANSMQQWDPSIKSLTAFPDVLANLGRNQNWTAALGNAYYNQPGDVMNAVQAMRFRAQQAGALRTTAQYRVVPDGGIIVIQPVNPAYVYVPYYNPWVVYGAPLSPWGGYYLAPPPRGVVFGAGVLVGFTAAIALGAFVHFGWGYHNWEPNWHGGVVVYNHTTYISHSTTVINRGNFGGYNRGVYERPGSGVPANFHPAVTREGFRTANPGVTYRGSAYEGRPAANRPASPYTRPSGQAPSQYSRPTGTTPQPGNQYGRQAPAQTTRPVENTQRPAANPPAANAPTHQGAATHQSAPTHQTPEVRSEQHQGGQQHQQQTSKKPAPKKEEERR
jgi:hypothetical protein